MTESTTEARNNRYNNRLGEINFPEPFSKMYANRLPVFIISFLPLATLLQFLGYVPAHHFLAQLHEQKSFNHL